jgi:hypothetical protein
MDTHAGTSMENSSVSSPLDEEFGRASANPLSILTGIVTLGYP